MIQHVLPWHIETALFEIISQRRQNQ